MGRLVACLGLLLHSLVDFNLHIPSNALIFLLLACMSVTEPVCQQPGRGKTSLVKSMK